MLKYLTIANGLMIQLRRIQINHRSVIVGLLLLISINCTKICVNYLSIVFYAVFLFNHLNKFNSDEVSLYYTDLTFCCFDLNFESKEIKS